MTPLTTAPAPMLARALASLAGDPPAALVAVLVLAALAVTVHHHRHTERNQPCP